MKNIKLALDWTPNTNHSGFFVSNEKGFYKEEGLEVNLISPAADDYKTTPAKKVELGAVDFALCPMESVISYQTKAKPFDLVAVAALLQEDLSAIATLKTSNMVSPKALDGKSYASYKARYEDGIVEQMVKNDGGKGNLEIKYPDKLGIWEVLLHGKADSTWIFTNWEGLQAEKAGVELQLFKMRDYDIPYSYSPVIAASAAKIAENKEDYSKFIRATRKGFLHAIEHVKEAAEILEPYVGKQEKPIDLIKSQQFTNSYYGNAESWGQINANEVQKFLTWLSKYNLEENSLKASNLITSDLLTR